MRMTVIEREKRSRRRREFQREEFQKEASTIPFTCVLKRENFLKYKQFARIQLAFFTRFDLYKVMFKGVVWIPRRLAFSYCFCYF